MIGIKINTRIMKLTKLKNVYMKIQSLVNLDTFNYYLGLNGRKPDFVVCEHQRRRLACAYAQSGQRLCYSLPGRLLAKLAMEKFQYSSDSD